jgi:hypothetical protein
MNKESAPTNTTSAETDPALNEDQEALERERLERQGDDANLDDLGFEINDQEQLENATILKDLVVERARDTQNMLDSYLDILASDDPFRDEVIKLKVEAIAIQSFEDPSTLFKKIIDVEVKSYDLERRINDARVEANN